ncbi:MAG: VWA domain-containing protein [bacterium]
MPITFANPGLLFGALAAALPIIIHLLSWRRIRRQQFSDLRFLESVQIQQSRKLNLRRLLLLLLRVLIILCIVFGVARPRVSGLAALPEGERSVLFILDASASMQTQHADGDRFEQAKRVCADMVTELPAGSEVQVLVAGATVEPLFTTWMPAGGPVATALATIRPSDGPFHLTEAIRMVRPWLATARTTPLEIVLLSDLQRGGINFGRTFRDAVADLLMEGPVVTLVRQVGEVVANGGIRAVNTPRRAIRPGESLLIAAEVRLEQAEQVCLLELDGRRVAEAVAAGPAGAIGRVEFALTAPGPGSYRGLVRKQSDRLPVDDDRPFVLKVREQITVLLAHGNDRGPAGRGGWRYLAAALAPAGDEQPLFVVRDCNTRQLVLGDLAAADVVVFVDPDPLGRQLLGGLLSWLAEGGSAAFLVGDPTLSSYLGQTMLPALGLPPLVEYRVRDETNQERLVLQMENHPIFQGLDSDPRRTLTDIPWRRFFEISEGSNRVVMAFSGSSPALLEGRYGQGRFVLAPFNLNLDSSGLPLSPMFLPWAQRLLGYLALGGAGAEDGSLPVGERPETRFRGSQVKLGELADAAALLLYGPGNESEARAADLAWRHGVPALVGPVLRQKGFYAFLAGGDTVGLVAAVPPAAEGDPQLSSVATIRQQLEAAGLEHTADLGRLTGVEYGAAMIGKDISGWLFGLAIFLLCLELYLARGTGSVRSSV